MNERTEANRQRDAQAWAGGARVVIFGCGGIGGVVAARLANAGRNIVVVTNNGAITDAVGRKGLHAELAEGALVTHPDVVTNLAGAAARGRFDVALLAVPPNRIEAAAASAREILDEQGVLVPLANGLPEEHLVGRFGDNAVVGGIVGFGASQKAPGSVVQTSEGGLTVGRLSGELDDAVLRIASLLAPIDGRAPENITQNLRGARFSKLAINCAISSLGAIGGDTLGSLMRHRFARRLCLEVMTEAVQTSVRLGIRLEKLSNTIDLEWLALDDEERTVSGSPGLLAKHTVLLAVGARYRRLRSSMLAAIERGREPPVVWLNGEVVSRARELGLEVPVNAAVVELIQAIARGEKKPGTDTLRALFDDTRPVLRDLKMAS